MTETLDRQALADCLDNLNVAMHSGDVGEQRRAAAILPLAEFCIAAHDMLMVAGAIVPNKDGALREIVREEVQAALANFEPAISTDLMEGIGALVREEFAKVAAGNGPSSDSNRADGDDTAPL